MAYLGKSPSQGVRNRYYFTASGGETSISGALTGGTLTFTDGNYVDVTLNGVTLVAGTDYNTSTANTIAGLSALTANDVVEIVVYDVFSVFSGNVNSDFSVGGNLSVTGTTAFTGATTITGLTTTGDINFGDNDKAVFGAGSDLSISHNGSYSLIADSGTGNLILACQDFSLTNPAVGENMITAAVDGAVTLFFDNAAKVATTATGIDVTGALSINSFGDPSNNYITLRPNFAPSASGGVGFAAKDHDGANNDGLGVFGHDGISFTTGGSERLRITSAGLVGINVSSPAAPLDIAITSNQGLLIDATSGNNAYLTITNNGSNSGAKIGFDNASNAAVIGHHTHGNIIYANSSGNVGIGISNTSDYHTNFNDLVLGSPSTHSGITIASGTSHDGTIAFADGTSGDAEYKGFIQYNHTPDAIRIGTNGVERMRIDSSGNLLVGKTSESDFSLSAVSVSPGASTANIKSSRASGGTDPHLYFYNSNGLVGSITTGGTATAYNTSSDYRLKENVTADWDATTRLKQLNPVRFNFIADADTTVDGFLAHEVQSIVPEAITGTKDEVDKDGNPVMQGIDQSKLVPLLVKTIIELEARIAALET